MDIVLNIFSILFLICAFVVGLLSAWQEINLNKEYHDKQIEKIEIEIKMINENILHNKLLHAKSMEQLENLYKG